MNAIISSCYRWSRHEGVLLCLLVFTLAVTFYRGYGLNDNYYAVSQWLVTYEPGFMKRALLGTLVQLEALSHLSGYPVLTVFFWVSNTFLVLLYLLAGLIMVRMATINRAAIFFIPYFLVGPLLRTQSVYLGYTDHAVMILAILIAYFVIKQKRILAIALVSLGILVHETVFVLAAPIIVYWGLIHFFSQYSRQGKSSIGRDTAILLVFPSLVFAALIIFQEMFVSKEHLLSYLNDMLSRQDPPNYRIDMISEIYTFTFRDWYLIHKDEALIRLFAWGGIGGYFFVIFFVALALHTMFLMHERNIKNNAVVLFIALLLVFSPLALHVLVVDHDRVWNLVTWISFLAAWIFWESFGTHFKASGKLAFLFFIFTICAILFPQARSDLQIGTVILIYTPLLVWQLVWMAGHLAPPAKRDEAG